MNEPIACNLNALSTDDRARRLELVRSLLAEAGETRELTDGYELAVDASLFVRAKLEELADFERRCCGFLNVEVTEARGLARIALTGPPGTKDVLRHELGLD